MNLVSPAGNVESIQLVTRRLPRLERAALADSFEAVALEWLSAGCPGGRGKGVEAGAIEQLTLRLKTYVFPYVGNWPVGKKDAPELLKVLRWIEGRGRHETAAARVGSVAVLTCSPD